MGKDGLIDGAIDAQGNVTATAFTDATTANAVLGKLLFDRLLTMGETHAAAKARFRATYWILVALSLTLFVTGLFLMLFPLFTRAFAGEDYGGQHYGMTALGATEFLSFFLLRPIQRIKRLAGDDAQLTVIMTDHQVGVALRVIAMDGGDRKSIGDCAQHVRDLTDHTTRLIEAYFLTGEADPKAQAAVTGHVDAVRGRIQDALDVGNLDDQAIAVLTDATDSLDRLQETTAKLGRRRIIPSAVGI